MLNYKLFMKNNVRHVNEIHLNLISTSLFDDEGYHNHFGEGNWMLIKGYLVVARGSKCNSLYVTEATSYGRCNYSWRFFHSTLICALGHLSQNGMSILSKKHNLPRLKFIDLKVCTYCMIGKQHRVVFKSFYSSRKPNGLNLIQIDICSMDAMSLCSTHSYLTFIDDHSRKVWAYYFFGKKKTRNRI